ncbi:MAG: DUF4261 domain-containing protein [Lacipirellulaceae bacterium]
MSSRSRWIALVTLDEPVPVDPARFLAEYARGLGDAADTPVETSRTSAATTFAWPDPQRPEGGGGATLNVTLIDRPIPRSQLEGPCATAWYWPEADRVLRDHTAHLFVTLLDEDRKAVGPAMRMTRVVAALANATRATGILWGASGAVHEPRAFAELAATATTEQLPLNLWIDFRVYENDADPERADGLSPGFGMFTTGLDALGHREFETPRYDGDPQRLVAAVYNVAHYVLEKQAVLRDGEVIGLPNGDEVTIREERSMIDAEQEALRLDLN